MSRNINISTVSAKATLQNEGFLAKLSSTLMTRRAPPPEETETQTSLVWHKTSEVKERIKTATGTIPVYHDMSQEEVENLKMSVSSIPTLEDARLQERDYSEALSGVMAEADTSVVQTTSEKSADSKLSPNTYIVIDDYFPDDSGALAVSAGQKVELIDDYGGKASKKLRIESKDELDLLDNSAAKHKISIRPKRNHPDPRSRGHSMHEERWLVKDLESGQQGLVPSRLLGAPPPGTVLATSIKRSLQEMSSEESTEAKRKVTKELKDIKSSKMRKSAGRLLGPSPEEEAMIKRTATIKELIETEEEFVRDLEFVVRNYYALFDEELTPKYIRDQKDTIFGNFKFIADFHQNVLIEGVKYHANVPNLIGKTFLRLERDFDKHSEYCTTEPVADEYLEKNQKIKDYFEEFSEGIGDDKRLGEHLKLPIQRLNDYQLLLKEIIKFSNRLGDETTDLEKAHDLMQTIPQRATDAKFLASIEGFKGNLFKLGRLIRHDWFSVSEEGHKTRDRYLFLFKARILVTKVKRITDERSIFILRDIIRLPETSLCGLERPTVLEFHHIEPQNHPNYPIVLDAKTQDIRDAWLHIVKEHVIDTASVDDLLFDDEIRVVSDEAEEEELGHISPSAEGVDLFEELPEDSELYQVVPDKKGVEIPITKVTSDEPVSLKEQLHIEEEFVFATETSGKVIPIEIEKEETIRDIPITRESEQKLKFESVQDLDTSIKRALDREEEEDFWATETYSPPPKRRVTSPLSEFQDSTVDFVPEFKTENQIIKEIKVEEREELDLWSKREISRPQQRTTSYQSSNEPVPIVEEPISPINKSYKEVEEVLETQEDFDIWGTKERSPPPKKIYSLPPVEDTVLIEEEPTSLVLKEQKETYIELETEKEPNLNKEEHLDFWSVKETSTSEKVFEIQTEKESGLLSDIKEEEFDFWAKKDSSPKPKAKEPTTQEELDLGAKETSSPSFPETKQPETKEEELDFWAKQPSSPIPKAKEPITQEEELDFWAKQSSSPTSKAEQQETKEEVDFWAKQPSSTSPNTEQQETKEEPDFWAKQPSSPRPKTEQQQTQEEELEFWAKQSASLSPKAEQQETQEEELDIWAKQPPSPIIKAKEPTTQEEELDFWTKQPSSPSPKAEQQETKEELDFWAKQPSSPTPKAEQPETKEEELDFWSKQPSSPSPKAEQQETKEEELDFWANQPSSPTPKAEQPEKKEEELDFLSKEPSSPSSKEEKSTIKTEVAFEKTDEPSKAPESISQKIILEITSKEQKEKEEAVDFWSIRESSPPLRKRSVPALKDYSTPTYPEVCQDQEDINLEQVEISVFKAEEKVAEQKQDFNLQTKEEEEEEGTTFKVFDKPSKETPEDFTSVRLDKSGEVILEREKTKITEKTKVEAVKVEVKGTEQKTEHVPETFELPARVDDKIQEQETKPEVKEKQETGSDKRDIGKKTLRRRSKPEDTATPKIQSVAPAETSLEESPTFKTLEKKDNTSETLRKKQDKLTQEEEFCEPLKTAECPEILPATTMDPSSAPGGGQKPVFSKPLIGDVVEPGDGTSFICEIQHPAQYYVTWLKDNKVLDDKLADRVIQQDENCRHALKILHCQLEDSGIYTAKATDNRGAFATSSAQLLVQELSEEEKATRIAEKKPFFLVKMRPTEVIENTNLSYAVHVKGDPMPAVTFYKDNERLQEDDRVKIRGTVEQGKYELVISHVQMKDAGIYRCIAMNKFEQAECEAKMGVLEEEITLQSLHGKGSLLQPGESADFKWFRDGVEFNPIDRFNVMFKDEEDTLALVFQNVTPDDAGIYTCVASTSCGKISCSAELTVEGSVKRLTKDPEPPGFLEELSDTFVTVGGTAMLECRISGYPKPDLTWCCNGIDLRIGGRIKQMWEDDESVTLIIKNISEGDKGLYTVKATNELGSVESSGRLVMRTGPKFRKFEKAITCNIDVPLKFIVEVDGEPLPELKWLKDGKEIQPNDHIHFESQPDGVFMMHIDRMTPKDCGSYSMVATNDMGQRAETFEIQTDTPPEITRGLDPETEKKASNDHTFEVRANGSPSPTATWYKNGKEISTDDKYRITKDGNIFMLKLRNLKRSDMGQYKIVLENRNGKDESEGALIIRGPPEFTTPMKNAFAKEGAKDTKFFVEWDANPRPTVKWFFKDKVIHEDTPGYTIKSTDTTSLLIIHDAIEEFTGPYSLKASNEYGDRSTSAKFRLHEKPQVIEPLQDVEFLEKTKCKFQCKVSGCPLPEVKWTKNGSKWTPNETEVFSKKEGEDIYYLYFETISTDDTAKYVGTFTNVEGSVTSEGSIIVNTPPTITGCNFQEGKKLIAMHKFVLEVEATAVPEAEATWYLNDRELKEDEDKIKCSYDGKVYKLERLGSDPDHTGEYKCKLKNKIKEVEVSGLVTIIEKEARVRQPLKDTSVKENQDATIQCQIVGDPIPTVEWFRNGKPVMPSGKIEIREDREKRMHYLTFKDLQEEDKSTFTLVGKNEHGTCETLCVVGIYVAPRPGELQDVTVDYGRDLWLSLFIHAIPPPKMTWFKNGEKLSESERILYHRDEENEMYSFEIKSTVVEDGATYTFKAENEGGEGSGQAIVKIHTEAPTIVSHPEDMESCLEDEVTFITTCAGLPVPVVEWRNKDSVLKEDDRHTLSKTDEYTHTLTIRDITMKDYGTLKVTAINLVSEASSYAELTQKKLPCEILQNLENVTRGGEGEAVSLNVVIRGSPRPKFVWTKDGDEVEATANIKLGFKKLNYCEATISLTLVEASSADSGQYRLRFYNELNEAQTETALVVRPVRRKPKISGKPKDLQVIEMEPGMFKCKIAGYPKPEVTWLKDGRIVRPTDILNTGMTADGEYFLEFKKVTLEDAGKYTVVAKNDEGKVEHDMNLVVNPTPSKPKFISGLKATKVICGYPCRMEVTLDGFPRPKVAWLKNGKPVEIDGSHIKEMVTDDGKVILQIASATDDDAGEYTAVASNDLGENASSATLSVLDHERKDGQPDGPPSFSEGLKDSTFDEGKTIKLPVSVKGGPVPDMKWYKDGKEIKLGKRVFFTYDGDKTYLEIHPCEGADSGMYKCVIENPSGKKETECEVRVRKCFEPPSFTYLYPNQQQLPGLDVKFTIKVDGVPKPELSWFFNGKKITPDGEKYRIRKDADGCTLFVKETTYSDSGAYKVVAKNKEGEVEHEASLVVADDIDPNRKAEAPTILKAIGDQELYEGYTAKFKAVVAGRPQPEFEWFRNGVKLFPNNRYIAEMDLDGLIRLTIKYVCQEDTGLYELRVWNEHGQASCKGKLICECISKEKRRPVGDEYMGFDKIRTTGAPIPIPDRPIISALSDRRCTLSWVPFLPPGPMLPVTYQVEMCECPEGDWFTPVSGIRGNSVELKDLCPKSDYKFRVRVENKYGVSEPSPYVTTYRNQLERNPLSHEPFLEPTIDTIYDGPYVPAGFKIDRAPSGSFYAPPRFLRLDHDTQYGMKNFSGHVKWIGYGYPTPKLRFYFKDHELHFDKGSRYKYTQEADGEIFLFIDNITEDDVGWYKCEAYNEYGLTHQRIRLGLSEYPRVLQHLQEVHIKSEHSGRILCRIAAYPPCDVTWFKDWREIRPSMKHRPQFIEPDMYVLNLNGVNIMDTGLYSMAAVNVSGAVSSSCMVNVIEDDAMYNWFGYGRGKEVMINMRHGTLEDHYDIGDELGRGTQGVTFYCTERFSGRNFAAKSMWGTGQFKDWMHNEFEMMNFVSCCNRIVRLYDAYEGPKNLVLVEELCAGGELLHVLTQRQYYTEYEIALYIRQILEGLDYMHDRWIAHLGLNIGDIMVTRVNGHDIKIGDLSLARNIRLGKLRPMEYGMPEFVAPEIVKGEGATYAADMWAVGVITYLLLSGTSPFRGEHDRETLTRIQNGELRFDVDAFAHLSDESKDFIAKLLQYQPQHRLDVKSALVHPWIKFSEMSPLKPYTISTDRLKTYYYKYKDWYLNASCKRWYRRRTLASAFTHPSRMVYPPGEEYTPPDTPEREIVPVEREDFSIPEYDLSYEIEEFRSDSRYQHGPDTYLLQVRDPDFPARIRSYMNLTRCRSPVEMFVGRDLGYDYERTPVIHERRRFTDIMDEEIKDERRRRTMIDKYTAGFIRSKDATCSLDLPGRVKKEVSSRYIRKEEVTKKEYKDKSRAPFLREKPSTVSVTPGMDVVLSCVVTGNPEPVVQWYRNDIILGETSRISIGNVEGRSQLSIKNSNDYDLGFYKIMARNDFGTVAHKFRIVRAQIPGMCDPPEVQEVSGSQILLKWSSPIDDGDAPIEYYHLQKKSPDTAEWSTVSDYIAQEVFLVESLSPNNLYQFRVAARNIRGSGDFSIATCGIRTGSKDDPRLKMPVEQQLQKDAKLLVLQLPGARGEIRDLLDYSREIQHVPLKSGDAGPLQMSKYQMVKEIARGRFSRVMRCIRKDDQRTFACKILLNHDRAKVVKQEYEAAKSLRHERLTTMYETCELPDVTVFIMEYFGGPDVLTFLADKLQYTEQHVSIVINQVLDALSYLHWRGLCHLNIQPDNVVVISPHKLDIKVGDFGATQKVNETGSKVEIHGLMDYTAPEVLFDQTAYPSSDIWSVGVLTYILLTGESPFLGEREQETMENIQCVRSKFEILGELTSQEATRFILLIFKRDPIKRPNEEECREHRWLGENDFMVKKRERHPLSTNRLREYSAAYHMRRQKESSASNIFSSFMDQC